jgi:hypothetical protein
LNGSEVDGVNCDFLGRARQPAAICLRHKGSFRYFITLRFNISRDM